MNVLFLGGYGNISWWCVKKLLDKNIANVYVLNRGQTIKSRREIDPRTKILRCDLRDVSATRELLKNYKFDVVCDFICYNKKEAEDAVALFKGQVSQYIVISSAAVYDRRNLRFPLVEDLPQYSEYDYVANKIEVERVFFDAKKKENFPVTIVRPAQTYDTLIPDAVGRSDFTNAKRMLDNKPIILFGDGTNVWTLTHSSDFANAFVELIGNKNAIGEAYHITSDELITWREIVYYTARALEINEVKIKYIPTSFIKRHHPEIGVPLKWHKLYCDIYDNSKIKAAVPGWKCNVKFFDGIKQSINWLNQLETHKRVNEELNNAIEDLLKKYCVDESVEVMKVL